MHALMHTGWQCEFSDAHRLAKCECSDAQAGLSHLLKFMDTFTRDITNQQVFISLFTDRGKV